MKFLTLSEREIKNSAIYNVIRDKHIVISISSAQDEETIIPPNVNRISTLYLKFDDVSDIDNRFIYFDRSMAKDILDFVELYCNQISLIIVQCQAGLSRSVAVASALSKIINYTDDKIFTKGIPNMFVYSTILDYFFGDRYWQQQYSKINQKRLQSMNMYLSPATIRLAASKEKKRCN